ncbi:MAG: hypothetical protein HY544_01425 [Candidatus Diapherotrites archaeon]|uniref:Uncharacterized protein n=1 Tax=Candidatus Iainarchaeum sp. TaxID=3101447 RepID=A0A8T3YK29_9ARCH|nr:hypothetical protein [Candidatus Diapherotrites archaeon]
MAQVERQELELVLAAVVGVLELERVAGELGREQELGQVEVPELVLALVVVQVQVGEQELGQVEVPELVLALVVVQVQVGEQVPELERVRELVEEQRLGV